MSHAVGACPDDDEVVLVSGPEAAAAVGVATATIRTWVARKHLQPVARRGTTALYNLEDVYATERRLHFDSPTVRRVQVSSPDHLPACVAPRRSGSDCLAPSVPDAPIPLCRKHLDRVGRFVMDEEAEAELEATSHAELRVALRRLRRGPEQTGVVYFIERQGLIKIGTTTMFQERMWALMPERILRVLPGDRIEERALHELFRADQVRGEWFNPSEDLLSFIEETVDRDIQAELGTPTVWGDLTGADRNDTL